MATDFVLWDHISIWLLEPISPAAQSWAEEHLPEDAQRWGNGIAVEARYIGPIMHGFMEDGLTFQYR